MITGASGIGASGADVEAGDTQADDEGGMNIGIGGTSGRRKPGRKPKNHGRGRKSGQAANPDEEGNAQEAMAVFSGARDKSNLKPGRGGVAADGLNVGFSDTKAGVKDGAGQSGGRARSGDKPVPVILGYMAAQNFDLAVDPNEPRYCYCDGVSYGEMIGCEVSHGRSSQVLTERWICSFRLDRTKIVRMEDGSTSHASVSPLFRKTFGTAMIVLHLG